VVPDLDRSYIWNNIGISLDIDNNKSKKELGIQYYSIEETANDMMEQMIELGAAVKSK
jgi:hypothetical protein